VSRLLLILLLLTGCAEPVQNAPKAGQNVIIPAFVWRIRDPETIAKEHGQTPNGTIPAAYVGRRADGTLVITTPPPRAVDDDVATSLGHEVMHIALGQYHD
jgi:hypothetical protein